MVKSAFIPVDLINDFFPDWPMGVPGGDEVIGPTNDMLKYAELHDWYIIPTRCWHKDDSEHFVLWKKHGVQKTPGAEFHKGLIFPKYNVHILSKGMGNEDAYSAFNEHARVNYRITPHPDEMSLVQFLRRHKIKRLYISGLATDWCVKETVLDALRKGFEVYVLLDAIKAINLKPDDGEHAIAEMQKAGAVITTTMEVINGNT